MGLIVGNINAIGRKGGVGPPPVLDDGNTVAWYDYKNLVTKDGSDLVSVWGDQSGLSHDLLQAVGTNQPLWQNTGVLFDGVDNFMKANAFTFNQPEFIYIVFKQITWVILDYIFDGDSINTAIFRQNLSTPNLITSAGTFSENQSLALNTFGIARVLFNGANSSYQINENTKWTGDSGSLNAGGFTLGSRAPGTAKWTNIQVKEIILRKVADGATDEANIYNYLKNKYGL